MPNRFNSDIGRAQAQRAKAPPSPGIPSGTPRAMKDKPGTPRAPMGKQQSTPWPKGPKLKAYSDSEGL